MKLSNITKVIGKTEMFMSHLEISEMTGIRQDSIKRTIDDLYNQGVIELPQIVEVSTGKRGPKTSTYIFIGEKGKRDSIVVIAKVSAPHTAALVDRWIKLEKNLYIEKQRIADRHQARLENPIMNTAIKDMRVAAGKDDPFYVYSNEANMINKIVLGVTAAKWRKDNNLPSEDAIRDHIPPTAIKAIQSLQDTNTVLLELGFDFQTRKDKLKELYDKKFKAPMIQENALLDGY